MPHFNPYDLKIQKYHGLLTISVIVLDLLSIRLMYYKHSSWFYRESDLFYNYVMVGFISIVSLSIAVNWFGVGEKFCYG